MSEAEKEQLPEVNGRRPEENAELSVGERGGEGADAGEKPESKTPVKGFKENLYDKIPLTVKQLDVIIIILLIAFVVFFIVGALKGNGIL